MKFSVVCILSSILAVSGFAIKSNSQVPAAENRLVAIGDIHGDYDNAIKVLKLANIVDSYGHWIGGKATLVQTGDVVDRGPDTIKLYNWLSKLRDEAKQAGGLFIPLLGNHELMNLQENYKYVTEEDIDSFGGETQRKKEFSKSGFIGNYLRGLNITAQVGDTVFVHGGINPSWAKSKVQGLNIQSHEYLVADTAAQLKKRELYTQAGNGPLWYRGFAQESEPGICTTLKSALDLLGAKRIVMGHTITDDYKIKSRCSGQAILIDVAMSSYYDGGHFAALELTSTYAHALYPDRIENLPIPK